MSLEKSTSNKPMVKRVVVLEFVAEFEEFSQFLKEKGLQIDDFEIVALDTKLQAHLRKNRISYSDSLAYFDSDSQKDILLKFDEILKHVEKSFSFVDSNGVERAYLREIQHYLECYFYYVAKIVLILEGIHKKNPGLELYVTEDESITGQLLINNDRLVGLTVEQFAQSRGIKTIRWPGPIKSEEKQIRKAVRTSIVYSIFNKIFLLYSRTFRKRIIIVPTTGYGFQTLIDEVRRRNPGILFLTIYDDPKDTYKKYLGVLYGFISGHFRVNLAFLKSNQGENNDFLPGIEAIFNEDQKVFEVCGVDLSQILLAKANKSLGKHLNTMQGQSVLINTMFRDLNIKLLISPWGRGVWALAPELAKKYNIPSLFVSHGTHPVPRDALHHISIFNLCTGFMLGEYSHIALSTPVQEDHLSYFKQKYSWINNREIKTGPLVFARTEGIEGPQVRKKLGLSQDDFVILHATSIKAKGTERFHFLETVDESISALSDIVKAVSELENYKLIVRIHASTDFTERDLKSLLPESDSLVISSAGPFSEALAAADLLLSYSSTCIDEALINKVPVLLYDKWNRYNHYGTGIFEDADSSDVFPVCYVNRESKLSEAFEFMNRKVRLGEVEKMDVSRYKYSEDYSERFYDFVAEQINREDTDENRWADSGKLIAR